jgi:ankyrin repeat protein
VLSKCVIAVNFILAKGADINHQDKNGRTALLAACHWQQVEMAELLIKHGANLDIATTQSGWKTNPLIASCFKQNYDLIELLIINGADVNLAIELNKQENGFRLTDKELNFITKAQNMRKIMLIKKL